MARHQLTIWDALDQAPPAPAPPAPAPSPKPVNLHEIAYWKSALRYYNNLQAKIITIGCEFAARDPNSKLQAVRKHHISHLQALANAARQKIIELGGSLYD